MALRIRVEKANTEDELLQNSQVGQGIKKQTSTKEVAINVALISAGKQIIMQSTNKVANHIGKSYEMQKLNDVIGIVTDVGVALSSPQGFIMVASKYSLQALESVLQQQRADMDQRLAWQRSGNAVLGRQ